MPSPEECRSIQIEAAKSDARISAISERLDEVLVEIRDLRKWLLKFGMVAFVAAIFGVQAMPIINKLLGITG